jgi:superfamily II DNA or RNA helicase
MGRPPEGKPKDAQGHAVTGDGHRIVENPGIYGGKWYRDKRGFVQYGVLQPRGAPLQGPRFAPLGGAKPLATRAGGKAARGATASAVETLTGIRNIYATANATGFGLSSVSPLTALLSGEIRNELNLGNVDVKDVKKMINTGTLPSGAGVLSGLIASKLGLPLDSLEEFAGLVRAAERGGFDVEDALGRMIDERMRLPDGSMPDNYEETRELLIASVFEAFDSLQDDHDVQTAVSQAVSAAQANDFIIEQAINTVNTHRDKLGSIFDHSVPVETRFVRFLAVSRELGLLSFVRDLEMVRQHFRPDGSPVPIGEQLKQLGAVRINTAGVSWMIRRLNNLAGTDQAHTTLAQILPVLLRYDAWQRAKALGSDADQQVASFTTPDGEARGDFVHKFAPGTDQFERFNADPSAFFEDPQWQREGNLPTQDDGLEVALVNQLIAESPPELLTRNNVLNFIKHTNAEGERFASMLEDYASGNMGAYGYHLTKAFAANAVTLKDAFDDRAVEGILTKLAGRADRIVKAMQARVAHPEAIKATLPPDTLKHLETAGFGGVPITVLPTQLRAVAHALAAERSICGLDVGLGKTLVAALFAASLLHQKKSQIVFHVLPKMTIDQYPEQLRTFLGPSFQYRSIATQDISTRGVDYPEALATLEAILAGKKQFAPNVIISNSWLDGGRELEDLKRAEGLNVYDSKTNQFIPNPALSEQEYEDRLDKLIPQLRFVQLIKAIQEKYGAAFIIDEAHSPGAGLRNEKNIAYKVFRHMTEGADHVLGMTANAASNGVKDIVTMMGAINPEAVTEDVRRLQEQYASVSIVPKLDADGNPTGQRVRQYSNLDSFMRGSKDLMPFFYQKVKSDPDVRAELESAGFTVPQMRIRRRNHPVSPLLSQYLSMAENGHDDYVRLEKARIRNERNINRYRNFLAGHNPYYADKNLYPDEALWSLRTVTRAQKDDDGNFYRDPVTGEYALYEQPVAQDYKFKPPRKDVPLRWDDVKDDNTKAALYKYNLAKKIRLDPAMVWGNAMPEAHRGAAFGKVEAAVEAVLEHMNSPVTNDGCIILAVESVQAMKVIRDRLREEGVDSPLIAEFRGDGDSTVVDKRLASDRDAAAKLINKKQIKVALMSIRLAVGLNLQHASKMVMIEEPSTVHHMDQTLGRISRIGGNSLAEIEILNLNTDVDFKALRNRYEKALQVLPLFQHDELLATSDALPALINHIEAGLERLGLPTGPDYHDEMKPVADRVALAEQQDRLGLGGIPHDLSRFKQVINGPASKFLRIPASATEQVIRYAKNGLSMINQKAEANEILYQEKKRSKDDYEKVKEAVDRDRDLFMMTTSLFGQQNIVVPGKYSAVVPQYASFESTSDINPFAVLVSQAQTPDARLKRKVVTSLIDTPNSVISDSDVPGGNDIYIHYYAWELIHKYGLKSVAELVEGHERQIAEAMGLWNDTYRLTRYVKYTNMLRDWAKQGYIRWTGTEPAQLPLKTPELGEVRGIRPARPPPYLTAEEALLRFMLATSKDPNMLEAMRQSPGIQQELKHLGLEHKDPEKTVLTPGAAAHTPTFDPVSVWDGRQHLTVTPAELGQFWSNVKAYLDGGGSISSVDEAHRALTGSTGPVGESAQATRIIMYEFEKRGLTRSTYTPSVPQIRVSRIGKHNLPNFEDLPAEGKVIKGDDLEHYWETLYNYLDAGNSLTSHEGLASVLGLKPEDQSLTRHIMDEFIRQRLVVRS